MQYRKLCGEEVSILGFGTMRFPILEKNQKMIDEEKAEEMLDHAVEQGINYFDVDNNCTNYDLMDQKFILLYRK